MRTFSDRTMSLIAAGLAASALTAFVAAPSIAGRATAAFGLA